MKKAILLVMLFSIILICSPTLVTEAATFNEQENNDALKTANVISSGTIVSGLISDYYDGDYYKINLPKAGQLQLTLKNSVSASWEVEVYDASGNQLDDFYSSYGAQALGNSNLNIGLDRGTYYIRVSRYTGDNVYKQKYTLSVSHEMNRIYEKEQNDTFTTASKVSFGQVVQGRISNYSDKDYYEVNITRAGELQIAIPVDVAASWHIKVLDTKGKELESRYTSYGATALGTEQVQVGLNPGKYYVLLSRYTGDSIYNKNYKLTFKLDTTKKYEKEFNESLVDATEVGLDEAVFGRMSSYSDKDYYKINLPYAQNVKISMPQVQDASWQIELFNVKGESIKNTWFYTTYDATATGLKTVNFDLEQGTTYIRVGRYTGDKIYSQNYRLIIGDPLFTDVSGSHPYYDEIKAVSEKGVINGYGDGSFNPTANVKRHHVAAMIVRAVPSLPVIRGKYDFRDITTSHSNYANVQKLYQAGIIDGSNNRFNPEGTMTRAQLAKILVNTFGLTQRGGTTSFSDVKQSDWYYEYVQILASHGITTGNNGKFNPNTPVSRQHFVVFLYRALNK